MAWTDRPMEEVGFGPLNENNIHWSELFASHWDGRIKIYRAQFVASISDEPIESMIWRLSMEFKPLSILDGHGDISGELGFRIFDQQG